IDDRLPGTERRTTRSSRRRVAGDGRRRDGRVGRRSASGDAGDVMIELENVTIRSGAFALTNVSVTVPAGVYAVLMGGTGQGKTTILEAICGLRPIAEGRILLDGADVTRW